MDNYIEINREAWNQKTPWHIKSSFYDVESFIGGQTSLKNIELDLLGNISNLSILHLQCHFGQDSLSMARMGANVTGVDFSDIAIMEARNLAEILQLPATFINCNLYDLPDILEVENGFDIVFTSYGTIGWLPDMKNWANIVSQYLKPGGKFIFVEFHPVIWMFDNDGKKIEYCYFKGDPIVEEIIGTYADSNAPLSSKTITWNHSLSEVVSALLEKGLHLEVLKEFDYSPYNCLPEMEEVSPGKFQWKHLKGMIPITYALRASKPFVKV
jgi:2-polyprenyl-3-methyl-5-hydroxy-6-metoxy-1,4-benzoquinol methylase